MGISTPRHGAAILFITISYVWAQKMPLCLRLCTAIRFEHREHTESFWNSVTELFSGGANEELTALIQHKGDYYKATTIAELEKVVEKIKEKSK